MRLPRLLCGLGLGVGLVAGVACQPTGPGTASESSGGSETEGCTPGTANCTCGADDSCEPGLVCAAQTCVDGGVETTSTTTNPVTTTSDEGTTEPGTVSGTSGDSSSSTGPVGPECEPSEGIVNDACDDPAAPYCGPGAVCGGCDAIDCAAVSAGTPACDAVSGLCVQCTAEVKDACAGTTPICDAASSTCVGCSDHASCASGACDFATGACFASILYVDRAATCDGDGSPEAPFCEISDAVAKVSAVEPTVVRVKPSPSAYIKSVVVATNRKVAIVRDGNNTAKLEVDGLDSLVVNDGATLYVQNLQISKGDVNKGVFCLTGSTVWLERTNIVDRKGLGIEGVACEINLRQSRIYLNLAGGLKLNGGGVNLVNSFVVSNGNSFSMVAGATLTNKATLSAVYSTFADNDGKAGVEDSLECAGQGEVALRNSILFGQSDASSVDCAGATATNSVFDSAALTGEGNVTIKLLDPGWFVAPESGNFSIVADTPFKDVAVWRTGDPGGDYDGDPRPSDDGAADYVGADRPK